eukprot:g7872.t1
MPTTRQKPGGSAAKPNTGTTKIVCVAVASRIATVALMILANALLPTHDAGGVHKFRPRTFPVPAGPGGIDGRDGGVLSAFTRWDAAWFLSIADSGYPCPSLSGGGGGGGGFGGPAVDCRGTARAWGGEEYAHNHPGELRRLEESEEEEPAGGRGREQHGKDPLMSADRRPPCRADVPLEEQAHAFFPLYPWLVRWSAAALRTLLLPIGFTVGRTGSLVVAAVLVSNACFVGAALLLHRLGAVVTGDSLLAYRGALAFCFTPASVFFSTAYTESLYAALTFGGVVVLFSEGERRRKRARNNAREITAAARTGGGDIYSTSGTAKGTLTLRPAGGGGAGKGMSSSLSGAARSWAAAALLSLATLTRSNGIAGAGVLVLERLRWMAGDAGVFTRGDNDNSNGSGSATAHARRAATPAATGWSPVRTRSRSRNISSRGGADRDGACDAGNRDGEAAAAAAASSRSEACSRWNHAALCVRLAVSLLTTALQALLIIAPYILVQERAYRKFCDWGTGGDDSSHNREGVEGTGATAEDLLRLHMQRLYPWCAWRVPSVYAHVQSAYWNVGALRYYRWKQVPNFLLAAPALALTASGTVRFLSAQLGRPRLEAGAGVTRRVGESSGGDEDPTRRSRRSRGMMCSFCPTWLENVLGAFFGPPRLPQPAASPLERTGAAAMVAQWAFLAVFAALCMNVQVSTRFLAAACPPLHWWTASLLAGGDGGRRAGAGEENTANPAAASAERSDSAAVGARVRTCLRWYLGVYFVVGAVLHANFLPWT